MPIPVPSGRRDAGLRDMRARSLATTTIVLAALGLAACATEGQARNAAPPMQECARSEEPDCVAKLERTLKAELARLRQSVTYRVLGSVQYPPQARINGDEGAVVVKFTLVSSGRLTDIRIVKSSGSAALDRAAQQAVQLASPIPLGPHGLPDKQIQYVLPIRFRI